MSQNVYYLHSESYVGNTDRLGGQSIVYIAEKNRFLFWEKITLRKFDKKENKCNHRFFI